MDDNIYNRMMYIYIYLFVYCISNLFIIYYLESCQTLFTIIYILNIYLLHFKFIYYFYFKFYSVLFLETLLLEPLTLYAGD